MTEEAQHPRLGVIRLAATVLAPFAAGYFLSYAYRAVNAVVAPDLVRDIGLSASSLGVMTSAYLVAFALFQIPLGILLDRFGPRRVQTALLLTAASGSLLFSFGDDALVLTVARALIGLGFAGGLMAGFKAVVLWYPPERHALANAVIMSLGGVGMIAASVPAEITVQMIGWRGLFVAAAVITVAVAAVIFLVVPEHPDPTPVTRLGDQLADVWRIFRDPFFWRIAPVMALTAGVQVGIHTLWAGPWFHDVAGLDRDGVALYLLMMAVAFLIGTLMMGVVADWLGRRGVDLLHVMLGGIVLFLVAQVGIIGESLAFTPVLWIVFAMTGQFAILGYPRLTAHFGKRLSGRAQTAINLLVFLAAFGAQAAIGALIDLFPTTADGGYDPVGYKWAFATFYWLQIATLAWFALRGATSRERAAQPA